MATSPNVSWLAGIIALAAIGPGPSGHPTTDGRRATTGQDRVAMRAPGVIPWTSELGPRTSEGDSLTVYLLTIGQGDQVWERFGHNAIGIRDRRSNSDIVYNWGLFDFSEPGFVWRFVRGEMTYWMAGFDAGASIVDYISANRGVTIQELVLSPAQRIALLAFVQWNAKDENKYYRYDYFRDNCSTRVRDALDQVLNGALRGATETVVTTRSYRDHALRLMADDALTATGIGIGLGRPADRRVTAWEEMFIPMLMRDRIRSVQVPDENGRLVPLVSSEQVVFEARRPAELVTPRSRSPLFLAISTLVAALVLGTARRSGADAGRRRGSVRALVVLWSASVGIIGVLLAFLRMGTEHVWAYGNMNVLQYNPLWLVLAVVLLAVPRGAHVATWMALVGGGLTIVAMLVSSLPAIRQDSLAVVLLAAPANLAVAWVAWRVVGADSTTRP